ncbi:MAG: AMP-binding protein [Aquabacterium sp.]
MERVWLRHYPPGVKEQVDVAACHSLVELLEEGMTRYAARTAFTFMGKGWTFARIDQASRHMAAWLQGLGLRPGDRVAVMLPNVPQYPVAVAAILRAGMVVVNVNPMYTPRELEHQLEDADCAAIVIFEPFARTLQTVIARTPVKHVLLASTGDMLGAVKGALVNHVVRKRRKLVPSFALPGAVPWRAAMRLGRQRPFARVTPGPDDIAVLQYTGGTTSESKGAVLLHRHVVASVLLAEAWNQPLFRQFPAHEQFTYVAALPLYHVFGFAVNLMLGMRIGACNILVPDPRDVPGMFKALSRQRFHSFPAVNTLFAAMARHPGFSKVDWSGLRQAVGGGMPVHEATARLWKERTGVTICEGYGLSETTAGVTCNPPLTNSFGGSIGLPLPGTDVVLLDEAGQEVPHGMPGELAVRGPQVMAGYWRRPEDTASVMTPDGFLRTGDIALMDERGYIKLIDRKKDMLKVSGFTVYPNEIEEVVGLLRGVRECAAIGVPDAHAGEVVKLFVVKERPDLTEQQVRDHCAQYLTGYKRPKAIVFTAELPRNHVGKVLRRALRENPPAPVSGAVAEQAEALTEGP